MATKAAEDFDFIAARLKELEAERAEAVKCSACGGTGWIVPAGAQQPVMCEECKVPFGE